MHRSKRRVLCRAAATPALASESIDEVFGPSSMSTEVADVISYAVKLCMAGETYKVHSWMVLLGLLKQEECTACQVLQALGLEDLYGAWHEVLWALNVADGLNPRAYTPRLEWGARAYRVINGSIRFAGWAGRDRVASEDLLMACAADGMLGDLFPDLDLSLPRVKSTVEMATGCKYQLPDWEEEGGSVMDSKDMFL